MLHCAGDFKEAHEERLQAKFDPQAFGKFLGLLHIRTSARWDADMVYLPEEREENGMVSWIKQVQLGPLQSPVVI